MPETTALEEKERIKTAIGDLGRGGIPTLEAAKFLLREVELEFVKERSREKSFKDAVREIGKVSREDRINEAMLKLGGIVVSMEISYGRFEVPQQIKNLAGNNESTFMQPRMLERLQRDLREIFGIKE